MWLKRAHKDANYNRLIVYSDGKEQISPREDSATASLYYQVAGDGGSTVGVT